MSVERKVKFQSGVEGTVTGEQLSLAGADLSSVPADLAAHSDGVRKLDFSWNCLTSVDHLDAFSGSLTSLVLDNNELTSASLRLPPLPALTTLWVNNNKIADLDEFLAHVRAQCPAITYLSMLKNAACPNFFTGKPSEDYHRYRRHVLSVLPSLRFLDASPVTDAERGIAAAAAAALSSSSSSSSLVGGAVGSSARSSVAIGSSPSEAFLHGERESSSTIADDSGAEFHIAPEKGLDRMPARDQNDVHAAFGVSTYTYVGKASEGNRFISNNEL